MSSQTPNLGDFPSEILDRILDHVGYKGAVNLSMTSRGFYNILYDEDGGYWKHEAQRVFKTPHVDSLIGKVPWKYLFRGLAKARVYTWGKHTSGRLGHSYPPPYPVELRHHHWGVSLPKEVVTLRDKFVVDMKAGGWSTTLLTSEGSVYTFGRLGDNEEGSTKASKIGFPDDIFQISSGRGHIIALSAKGQVYTCSDRATGVQRAMFDVKTIDSNPEYPRPDKIGKVEEEVGRVKKVVGGWGHSGALVSGVGILIWKNTIPTERRALLTYQASEFIVPRTNYLERPPRGLSADTLCELQEHKDVGQVLDFAMGEGWLVFITTTGKVFGVAGFDGPPSEPVKPPFQLHCFSSPEGQSPMTRISGSFRRFAVFNKEGTVHIGNSDIIRNAEDGKPEMQPLTRPDFSGYKIVDIAFGDYHGIALTDEGKVVTWGVESQGCGCLGHGRPVAGIVVRDGPNVELPNPAVVSFGHPTDGIKDLTFVQWAPANLVETEHTVDSGEGSKDTERHNEPEDGKNIEYYAFNITAAGWHSGALVLALDKEHAPSKAARAESDDAQVPENLTSHFGQPRVEREFEGMTLAPFREHGHRGIMGYTSPSGPGRMSRSGFVRSSGESSYGQGLGLTEPEGDTQRGLRGFGRGPPRI